MVTSQQKPAVALWSDRHFVGNHPALDFVNTVSDRVNLPNSVDRLRNLPDLAAWAVHSGFHPGAQDGAAPSGVSDQGLLDRAREVREAIWRLIDGRLNHGTLAAGPLSALAAEAAHLDIDLRLDGASLTVQAPDRPIGPLSLIAALAAAGIDAVFRLPAERLGACPACGWQFFDTSRSGRRVWCSMALCGNRTKVRRYRSEA